LEYIQSQQDAGKTSIMLTDSRITLHLLTNHKRHTNLIDKIRNKVIKLERNELKVEFRWIKAHAGKEGNELADRLAKEA
jgi:ribonuclease HI